MPGSVGPYDIASRGVGSTLSIDGAFTSAVAIGAITV